MGTHAPPRRVRLGAITALVVALSGLFTGTASAHNTVSVSHAITCPIGASVSVDYPCTAEPVYGTANATFQSRKESIGGTTRARMYLKADADGGTYIEAGMVCFEYNRFSGAGAALGVGYKAIGASTLGAGASLGAILELEGGGGGSFSGEEYVTFGHWWYLAGSASSATCAGADPGAPIPDTTVALPTLSVGASWLSSTTVQVTATVVPTSAQGGGTDAWAWSNAFTASTRVARVTLTGNGPFVAKVGLTRTLGTGYTYGASAIATVYCTVDLDPASPGAATPCREGTGGAGSADAGTAPAIPPAVQDDTDCPTGWGFINPLALVKTMKCLFIPTSAGMRSSFDSIQSGYNGSAAQTLVAPITAVKDSADSFTSGVNHATGTNACQGPSIVFPVAGNAGPTSSGTVPVRPLDTCTSGSVGSNLAGYLRVGTSLLIYAGGALAIAKLLAAGFGLRLGIGGGGGEE